MGNSLFFSVLLQWAMGIITYLNSSSVQVKWSSVTDRSLPEPPTAVFLHGILGCRKNWGT